MTRVWWDVKPYSALTAKEVLCLMSCRRPMTAHYHTYQEYRPTLLVEISENETLKTLWDMAN